MKLSIVVSYYKNLRNLELILQAFNQQSANDFEIIVSEDDNNPETIQFLEQKRPLFTFPIIHINQDVDSGFRKNKMLNQAIRVATADFIAFIDGDCIPHRHFVKEYVQTKNTGIILYGRRVMLNEKITDEIIHGDTFKQINFLQLILSGSQNKKDGLYFPFFSLTIKEQGIVGSNWAVRKEYLVAVNGFDEDFVRAGIGEDTDIEWRLKSLGLKMKTLKNKAIVYHLHHPRNYSDADVQINIDLMHGKKKLNLVKCVNGLIKLSASEI